MKTVQNTKLKESFIRQFHIDQILPTGLLKELELVSVERHETVIEEETALYYYYFFVDGRLKIIQRQENGRNLLIQYYSRFEVLGDVELFENLEATCTVIALQKSLLLRIPMERLRQDAVHDLAFVRNMVENLSRKLKIASKYYSNNLFYPVKRRLASYIFHHGDRGEEMMLTESYQEISEFLGTTYRQLHRAFVDLEVEGLIGKKGKRIKILDREKLKQVAGQVYMER